MTFTVVRLATIDCGAVAAFIQALYQWPPLSMASQRLLSAASSHRSATPFPAKAVSEKHLRQQAPTMFEYCIQSVITINSRGRIAAKM